MNQGFHEKRTEDRKPFMEWASYFNDVITRVVQELLPFAPNQAQVMTALTWLRIHMETNVLFHSHMAEFIGMYGYLGEFQGIVGMEYEGNPMEQLLLSIFDEAQEGEYLAEFHAVKLQDTGGIPGKGWQVFSFEMDGKEVQAVELIEPYHKHFPGYLMGIEEFKDEVQEIAKTLGFIQYDQEERERFQVGGGSVLCMGIS